MARDVDSWREFQVRYIFLNIFLFETLLKGGLIIIIIIIIFHRKDRKGIENEYNVDQ